MSRRSRRFRIVKPEEAPKSGATAIHPKIVPIIFFLVAYGTVAIGSLFYPLDYDLGWHLKYGQDVVVNHFISSVNTYSVELPGFHWINSSWLSDVLKYYLFTAFSFQGLMIAGVITMVLTFFLFAKAGNMTWWDSVLLFPLITFMEIPLTSASFRAQLVSFAGMGAILWVLEAYRQGSKKALLFLLPLFLIWVNIHGGFFLGILYLIGWLIAFIVQRVYLEKSESLAHALKIHGLIILGITGASILVTFINPWGWELYAEHVLVDFSSRFDKDPSQFLVEWKPLYQNTGLLTNHVFFGLILTASTVIVIWKRRHIQLFPLLIAVILMYLMAFNSRRFAWTMYLMSLPILATATSLLKPKNTIIAGIIATLVSGLFYAFVISGNLRNFQFTQFNWFLYCQFTGCSPQSAEFIISRKLTNTKMYTTYDWGGWLIWNYPQIKPLVDGRMSTWTDDKGYNAFLHYIDYENNWKDIDTSEYEVVYLSPGKRALFNRLLQLVDEKKWMIAYKDNFAFVFVRNKR